MRDGSESIAPDSSVPTRNFTGGLDSVDAIEEEGILAARDADAQTITVKYNSTDTLLKILEGIDGKAGIGAVLIYGTDGDELPEEPDFTRPFRGAGGTGAGGGAILVNALPPLADVEVPAEGVSQSIYVEEVSRDAYVADFDEEGNKFWRQVAVNLIELEIAALASIHNPLATSTDGLHVLLSDPVAVDAVPPVLGAQRQSTDADLQTGDIPGGTVEWATPPVVAGRPNHHATSSIAFYDSVARTLGFSDGSQYTDAADMPQGDIFFNTDITWCNANTFNSARFAPGTG